MSTTKCGSEIYEFAGFDKTNGNFYYRGSENWRYWGYDHSMASLKAGKVNSDNSITIKGENMMYLYQDGWFAHKAPIRMLNDRYLVSLSTFNGNICVLIDSNQYDINDVTESSTSINLIDSSVSVSPINIANKKALKMAFYTADSYYGDGYIDLTSIGPRCALNSTATSLIVKTDETVLTEYDIAKQKEKIRLQTKYPVYTFFMDKSTCVVVEKKNDNYYLETFDWTYPTTFRVNAPASMKVGASGTTACSTNGGFALD